ncbi:MAG: hypothetical protein PVG39_29445 [Desulfobacteraceae bacterium]|jgi:hypothetical protein
MPERKLAEWEKQIGITVPNSNYNHQTYFIQMAKAYGITWDNPQTTPFMGESLQYWVKLYKEDILLNNHPLKHFDSFHYADKLTARRLPGATHLALSYTVCMRKAVIKQACIEYLKQTQ